MRYNAHRLYALKDETMVPGITTFLKLLNKPALVPWANNLGLKGIDSRRYTDELADIGSLAHYMIECDVKQVELDPKTMDDYTAVHRRVAQICYDKYLRWRKEVEFVPSSSELRLVSETHKFGGTIDLYGERHGVKSVVDFKTGSGIYPESFTQLAACQYLLKENGYPVEERWVVRVGRKESEGYQESQAPCYDLHFKRFLNLINIYYINKQLGI